LDYLRRALDTENRSLVNELAELRSKTSIKTFDNIIMNNTSILPTLNLPAVNLPAVDIPVDLNPTTILPIDTTSVEMNIPPPAVNDFWSHNRMRQRHKSSRKKRAVMDLHEVLYKRERDLYIYIY
jgi:hypothetical protein